MSGKKERPCVWEETQSPAPVKISEKQPVSITPLAKKMAKEYNVDYTNIKGSGAGGRIQKEDILAFLDERKSEPEIECIEKRNTEEAEYRPVSAMRKTIGKRLAESKREIPHVYFQNEVDATQLLHAKKIFSDRALLKNGNKLTINHIILKCTAFVLAEFRDINARLADDRIAYFPHVNLGMAVSVQNGLLVPVILNAEEKSLLEISKEAFELAKKARDGKLMPEEYEDGTFTVSNLGAAGIDGFQAIINPPEAGILAIGAIKEKPAVIDGQIVIRPMMTLAGSFDHRLIDGETAAKFMARISEVLEEVAWLAL
ncbi:MAG: dihydrolipoamide acetyltransferase family protein [[Clostridium] scindens]